jgi:hypothetical protein
LPLIFVDEARRAVDEVMELLLVDRENLANHLEPALLLARLGGKLAQLGHVAHAQHETHDGVVLVGDRRPAQVERLHAAVGHRLRDLVHKQVLVEGEVDRVLADAGLNRGVDLRAHIGVQIGVVEHQIHDRTPGDVLRLEDRLEVGRVLGVHQRAADDGQHPLLNVLQHRLDVRGFLLEQRGALLDLLDHLVERDDRAPDLVHPSHRNAAGEVLIRCDLAHHRLHAGERASNY